MQIGRIDGATRVLVSEGCSSLPIRDEIEVIDNLPVPVMTSSWLPNHDELEDLVNGAPLHISIVGTTHPPISVNVGLPPDDDAVY
jgi:hypothetical protein